MLTIRRRHAGRRDRGSGTIYVLAMMTVVVLLTSAGLALGQALIARHRAAAAADLSAISAASRVLDGPISACKTAALVARSQGARLTTCRIDGEVAEVTVEVLSGLLSAHYPAIGAARAGPAERAVTDRS
jgi:secretion/DNA translocation related TadE-like protein